VYAEPLYYYRLVAIACCRAYYTRVPSSAEQREMPSHHLCLEHGWLCGESRRCYDGGVESVKDMKALRNNAVSDVGCESDSSMLECSVAI
jgi:hypothetical protein